MSEPHRIMEKIENTYKRFERIIIKPFPDDIPNLLTKCLLLNSQKIKESKVVIRYNHKEGAHPPKKFQGGFAPLPPTSSPLATVAQDPCWILPGCALAHLPS